MSLNYSANQFEGAYNPHRLRNWEVPQRWPGRRAAAGGGVGQRPIANDRGHLLPGVPRGPRGPWGCYRGTWNLPSRISRKQAQELSAPRPPSPAQRVPQTTWEKRSASHIPVPERSQAAQEAIERASGVVAAEEEAQKLVPTSLSVNPGGIIHMSDFAELS